MHYHDLLDTLIVFFIKFAGNSFKLFYLREEPLVFCPLSFIGFYNALVQNGDLFSKVALDIIALGFSVILDLFLRGIMLFDFSANGKHFGSQLHYLFFKLINSSFEAIGRSCTRRSLRLTNDGGSCSLKPRISIHFSEGSRRIVELFALAIFKCPTTKTLLR